MTTKKENTTSYKFHKYADLYPLASDKELQDLADDIEKYGLANPIVLYNGEILDGRNRYLGCRRAGIPPNFENWGDVPTVHEGGYGALPGEEGHADDDHDALLWVISQNSHRRHLSTSQLAMVAAKVAEVFKEDAKKRKLAGQNNKTGAAVKAKLPELPSAGKSAGQVRDEAAKIVGGVSGRSVQDASKILKESPALANKVSAGEMTVNQAKKHLKGPPASPTASQNNFGIPPELIESDKFVEALQALVDKFPHAVDIIRFDYQQKPNVTIRNGKVDIQYYWGFEPLAGRSKSRAEKEVIEPVDQMPSITSLS